jgi:hypothetical protein
MGETGVMGFKNLCAGMVSERRVSSFSVRDASTRCFFCVLAHFFFLFPHFAAFSCSNHFSKSPLLRASALIFVRVSHLPRVFPENTIFISDCARDNLVGEWWVANHTRRRLSGGSTPSVDKRALFFHPLCAMPAGALSRMIG